MSNEAPKAPARKTGLSPKEQKLQAMREKLANAGGKAKPVANTSATGFTGKSALGAKKTAFQRKAT